MTDFLDFLRRMNESAGSALPAWGIVLRVTVLLSATLLVALVLRRSSAALRHMVWTLSLVGTLLVPLCSWVFPAWQWAVLPQRQPSPPSIAPVVQDAPPSPSIAPRMEDAPLRSAHSPRPLAAHSPFPAASADQPVEVPATLPATVADHPTPLPVPRPKWSWHMLFAAAWAAGSFLGLVWLGVGVTAAWYVARRAVPAADPCWGEILRQLLDPCGIRRSVEVRECPQVSVPMTWGLFRPVILVPAGSAAWPEEIKRSVLLHELGHIRRSDCLMLLLGRLACVAYWFHPLAWLAARQLRKTSEQAADDLVLASHVAPPDYAEHLVGIAARMRGLHLFGHVALPMASRSDLEGRVLAILDPRRNHRSLKRKTCYGLMFLAVLLVIPCAVLRLGYAQKTSAPDASREPQEQPTAGKQPDASGKSATGEASKSTQANSRSAGLDELIRQVRQNEALYRNLDCTVHTVWQYEVSAGDATTDDPGPEGPSQLRTVEETNRTVTVGDRLYFAGEDVNSLASGEKSREKRIWVFDGSRTVAIEEGNSATVYQGRYEPGQFLPPHCWGIYHLVVNFPLSVYLQGTEAIKSYRKAPRRPREMGDIFEFNKVESRVLGEETIGGLNCVKVRVQRWYHTSSPPALQDLWLAKDRNFHVAQCRTSSTENGKEVPGDVTRVTKWREVAKGVWLPEAVQWQDLSPDGRRAKTFGKETRSLVVEKSDLNPAVASGFFTLPKIPASLPKFVVGQDGNLVDSPHHPAPVKAAEGTTLASILKRLAEEENRYTPLEVLATTQYVQLGGEERHSAGICMQFTVHERSVVAGDHLFHEEEQKTKLGDGTTASSLVRQTFDGRWSKEYYEYLAPPAKPQISASLDFENKDDLRPIRPHTLLFHDSRINSQLLSAYLASGWSDKLNGYSLTVEYVGDERIDGLHCYKLKCSEGQNGKSLVDSFVWLARDRNLLPLRQEWHEPHWSQKLPTGISFVEDLREIRPGQWCAFRATDLAFQKDDTNGLNVGHILLQWRKGVALDRVALDPQAGDRLFDAVEVPAGTQVSVQNELGVRVGQFTQPQKGNLELSLEKYRAMQRAAEESDEDRYDPKDTTTPLRKQRIDTAFRVLRSNPPAAQDERIEAAITILRNYLIFQTNTKKWAIAFRELIQIGKPAIPRLLRELDETDHVADRGHELRALGFVLRGIGDPQAVPALIRSLPCTLQPPGSDCGDSVMDRELLKFMQEHDNNNGSSDLANNFSIGRPINEVLPALQKLTGIKRIVPGEQGDQAYKNIYFTCRDGGAEEMRKKQRLFLQFAQRWADWWSKNWKSYVKDEGEAQVEQTNSALKRLSEVAPPRAPAATAKPAKESAKSTTEARVVGPDGRPAKAGTTSALAAEPPTTMPAVPGETPLPRLTASGKVIDPAGKPVAGATVYLREWSTFRISQEPFNQNLTDILATRETDAAGAFRFENVPAKPLHDQWLRQIPWDMVVAAKSYAIAWQHLSAATQSKPVAITLAPETRIAGRVTDHQGHPVRNADVKVFSIVSLGGQPDRPRDSDPETLDLAYSRLAPAAKTDADGKVSIAGLPREVLLGAEVTHDDFRRKFIHVATSGQPQPAIAEPEYNEGKLTTHTETVYSTPFLLALEPPLPRLVGRVTAADNKKPLPQTVVELYGGLGTLTDQDGRFILKEIQESPCRLIVVAPKQNDYLGRMLSVNVPQEKRVVPVDIELARGEILSGIVSDAATQKGVAGVKVSFDNGVGINKAGADVSISRGVETDSAGRFRLAVPPGKGNVRIAGPVHGYDPPAQSYPEPDMEGFFKEVEVVAGTPIAELKFTIHRGPAAIDPMHAGRIVAGTAVDADGKPVAGAAVGPSSWFVDTDGDFQPVQSDQVGHFSFRVPPRDLSGHEMILAIHKGRKLRGHVLLPEANPADSARLPVDIRLGPTGIVTGRVLESDKPIAGARVAIQKNIPMKGGPAGAGWGICMDQTKTDENGRFEFPLVEAGQEFDVSVDIPGYTDAGIRPPKISAGQKLELKPFSLLRLDKSVAGIVVDLDGNPLAGASVSASRRSGEPIPYAFTGPTGTNGRFRIPKVPSVPLTITAYIEPPRDSKENSIHFPATVDAEPGQLDVRIVLDPKLVRRKRADATPAALPMPAQILEKLQAHRDSVKNLVVEASWEEYQNDKPSSWEDGTIYKDQQARIRVRYHSGPGALASADKTKATLDDETYNGKFTVNTSEDPALDRRGNPLPPGEQAGPTNRNRSTMIYNGKWPGDQVNAESHRNPFKCMNDPVIDDLSRLLAAGKTVTVEPVKGQPGVYELGYEFDPKDDPDRLKHRVLVDAGKGWVVLRNEHLFPDGKSARLSTCDYRRGEDGWWLPTTGQFRYLWGKDVPGLDWRFNTKRVVINDPHFDEEIFQPELKGFPLRALTESVAGIIVDPDGKPVEGVSVRVDKHSGSELLMAFPGKLTGKDGRFAIDGLPNKPIPITAFIEPSSDSKDHVIRFPVEVKAEPGQKDLRIVLDPKLVRGKK